MGCAPTSRMSHCVSACDGVCHLPETKSGKECLVWQGPGDTGLGEQEVWCAVLLPAAPTLAQ